MEIISYLYKKSYFEKKTILGLTINAYILYTQRFSLYKITYYPTYSPYTNIQKS